MSSLSYPASPPARIPWRRLSAIRPFLVPVAALLVVAVLADAGPRLLLVVALPVLATAALANRLPRSVDASLAFLLGVLALGAGLISGPICSSSRACSTFSPASHAAGA